MDSKLEVCKSKLSEVACLAQQSARAPAARSNLLPRRLRQRSRLIDKQTNKQTITKLTNKHHITIIIISTISYCTHKVTQFGFQLDLIIHYLMVSQIWHKLGFQV